VRSEKVREEENTSNADIGERWNAPQLDIEGSALQGTKNEARKGDVEYETIEKSGRIPREESDET